MTLLQSLKKAVFSHAGSHFVRERFIRQTMLLARLKYVKAAGKVPEKAWSDAKAFAKFAVSVLKPSKFAKGWSLAILHSYVLTLLIALGDHEKLRRKVGKMLQKFDKQRKNLPALFARHSDFFALYVSMVKPEKEVFSAKLLKCLAAAR